MTDQAYQEQLLQVLNGLSEAQKQDVLSFARAMAAGGHTADDILGQLKTVKLPADQMEQMRSSLRAEQETNSES